MIKFSTIIFLILATAFPVVAEDKEAMYLPDIEVTEVKDTGNRVERQDMERDGVKDLKEALQYVPGITFTGGGARNDSNFRIRGFGVDSVPIYVDGVLMANPFRGEGDAARFLTGDLESITVHKGYSSTLFGANSLGGAVVMRIAKPKKAIEALFDSKFDFDSIMNYAGSTYVGGVGSKLKYGYAKVVYQYRDVDHFRLPSSFEPSPKNPQGKGDRLWSDNIDRKLTAIAGVTPIDDLDIWLTYIDQDSDKRLSPPDTTIQDFQIWEWPKWQRKSVSLNSEYAGSRLNLETLVYFDKYDNRMIEYYNMPSFFAGVHSPPSDYDEYSIGVRLKGGWIINDWNRFQVALNYKKEDHVGLKGGKKEIHVNEDTWSIGAEYSISPLKQLTFVAGAGVDMLFPQQYWSKSNDFADIMGNGQYIVKTDDMLLYTWQLGAFYSITDNHELRLTYARKNHFPNMSQRYSTRFGDTLPNPNLGPETANHVELGYIGNLFDVVSLDTAFYYSKVEGKIVNVELPNPDQPTVLVDYARNLDATSLFGFEAGVKFYPHKVINGGVAFAWNGYHIDYNQSGEIKVLSYYPAITASAFVEILPIDKLTIVARGEYISGRYADTGGLDKLGDYFLLNAKIVYDACDYFSISAGVSNIFDKLYEIKQYSPMAGRTYSLQITARY